MNKTAYGILMFISGAAIGATVAIKLVKAKYEKRANEEIESVREYYASKRSEAAKDEIKQLDEIKELDDEEKIEAYADLIEKSGYATADNCVRVDDNVNKNTEKNKIVTTKNRNNTILITPEELGEEVEEYGHAFDITTLIYYADGVMAYHEDEHLVDDIEDLVGTEFKEHFGDYEADAVFVRNFRNETDYEIIKDDDEYYGIWPKVRGEEDG